MSTASIAWLSAAVIVVALFAVHPSWRATVDCMAYTPAWGFCFNPNR